MAKKPVYNNESITSLKGADRVRRRPAVIFGSDGLEGCEHSIFEIVSNSIDEAREGYGKKIVGNEGIAMTPWKWKTSGGASRWILTMWKTAITGNWCFAKCTPAANIKTTKTAVMNIPWASTAWGCAPPSTLRCIWTRKCTPPGPITPCILKRAKTWAGCTKNPIPAKRPAPASAGSRIWMCLPISMCPKRITSICCGGRAVVNDGVTFLFRSQKETGGFTETQFYYDNGIRDHALELAGENPLSTVQFWQTEKKVRDRDDKPEYKCRISVAVMFSNRTHAAEYYHNSSFLEHGGAPDKAVRSAFVSQIDAYLKQNGKYNKNESKITFADVEDCLVIVMSSFSNRTSYENQTKKAITNKGIQEAMTEMLRHNLEIYFIENPLEAEKIAGQVLINKRSREDAEKTRLNLKKKLSSNMDITSRVAKFVDCRSRDTARRELFIVEGDSALGACKQARDPDFQAIMPIRGKILNCLKADLDRIFKSDVIVDLMKVLGCGVQVRSKANKDLSSFDLSALRWNKVILCTDADVDGFQIRTLLLTMLYRLTPDLIENGKVFIAESPLYEITSGNDTYFAYTEAEKEEYLHKLENRRFTVQRSKGLGENEPDMMSLTTMNPETRRLIKVMPDDVTRTAAMFDLLLGDDLSGRKEYIAENGYRYADELDVS